MKEATQKIDTQAITLTNSDNSGGEQFYSALQANAMAALKDILKSQLYPIQFPSQGDFHWYYQNINNVFNESTFDYISARILPGDVPGTAKLSPAGGFPNAYDQVITSIVYKLNDSDQAKLSKAQTNAQAQAQTVVSNYQTTFGLITNDQLAEVKDYGIVTKLDYVIVISMGWKWSGRKAANKPPLTYQQMAQARKLGDLLPDAPPSADQVISDVSKYLNMMRPVNALLDLVSENSWIIGQLQTNTKNPNSSNGGIKTLDPTSGEVLKEFQVGYKISKALSDILNDLNSDRTITLSMTTSQASGGSINVKIEGKAGFTVSSWLQFTTTAGDSYDMSKVQGTSTDASITLNWKGYSVVPMAPTAWQQATNIGWFYPDPIAQAVKNDTKDVSGFIFTNSPAYNLKPFKEGGDFGFLTNLVISNYPTISIRYNNANFSEFKQSWQENVTGNLKLFGFIELGSFSQGAYGSSYQQGANNSTFTVTFSASQEVLTIPDLQKTAYVIGGALSNPGVGQDITELHTTKWSLWLLYTCLFLMLCLLFLWRAIF
ncbi:hypothetical protein JYQ62_09065 [Nostoc sp. UHCC 0702]|nr:hypothetical protein JYQ62_09065 [Nostoc sp. UHCC 0702]